MEVNARLNFYFEDTCPFYMCDGNGKMLMGAPGREVEVECLCQKYKREPAENLSEE